MEIKSVSGAPLHRAVKFDFSHSEVRRTRTATRFVAVLAVRPARRARLLARRQHEAGALGRRARLVGRRHLGDGRACPGVRLPRGVVRARVRDHAAYLCEIESGRWRIYHVDGVGEGLAFVLLGPLRVTVVHHDLVPGRRAVVTVDGQAFRGVREELNLRVARDHVMRAVNGADGTVLCSRLPRPQARGAFHNPYASVPTDKTSSRELPVRISAGANS